MVFIDLYTHKERDEVKCPSGYTIGQCLGSLRKNWQGYYNATNDEKSLERTKYYARRIQNNEKDLGLKTTSFPHIGLYGDVFILNNKKGKRVVFEDHSALKEKQEAFEKWQAENSKKIQEKLQKKFPGEYHGYLVAIDEVLRLAWDIALPEKLIRPERLHINL